MAKLQLTAFQAAVLAAAKDNLVQAFSEGVKDTNGTVIAVPEKNYAQIPSYLQPHVPEESLAVLAAFIKAINLPEVRPSVAAGTTAVTLQGNTSNGSLQFVDGVLVSVVPGT